MFCHIDLFGANLAKKYRRNGYKSLKKGQKMTFFFLLTVICNYFDYVLLFLYKSCNASWYQFHPTATLADRHETLLGTITRTILHPMNIMAV